MLDLFQRAHKNFPLTPEERAILKFVFLSVATAALTGGTAAVQFIGSSSHSINWDTVLTVFLTAFGMTLYESTRKWFSAQKDGPLGAATQLLSTAIQKAAEQTLPTTSHS